MLTKDKKPSFPLLFAARSKYSGRNTRRFMRILIVDDAESSRLLLVTLLRKAGRQDLLAVRSGNEALNMLRNLERDPTQAQADLILMDVLMPGMDGIQVLNELKADPQLAHIPVITMTGDDDEDLLKRAFEAGASDFIRKPFSRSELWSRVAAALRFKTEQDRRRARELELRQILDSMPSHLCCLDRNGCIRAVNRPFLEFTGLGAADAIGKTLPEIFPGAFGERRHAQALAVMQTGAPGRSEIERVDLPTGETFWFAIDTVPDLDERDRVQGAMVFAEDITARKRADLALWESESRYRNLFQRLTVAIFEEDFTEVGLWLDQLRQNGLDDLRGYLASNPDALQKALGLVWMRDANDMALSMFGAKNLKHLLDHFKTIFLTQSPDFFTEQLVAVWEGSSRIELESRLSTIKGRPIHCIAKFFLLEENGELDLSRVVCIILDISSIKQAEEVIRQSEARYRAVVEDQIDLVCRYLPDGKISFVNEAYARYLGATVRDILGTEFDPQIESHELVALRQHIAQLTADKPLAVIEHRVVLPKLGERWQLWTHHAIFDPSGELAEFQAVGRDITRRKHMEQELHRAKEDAEAASRTKSTFLATMSHEMRTPLTTILGLSELLMAKSGLDMTQEKSVTNIQLAGERLLELINDILDLSKIEAGKFELEENDFDIRDLVAHVAGMFEAKLRNRPVVLNCHVEDCVPTWSYGSEKRLHQVLVNLVGNALKFTEQGEVLVRVAMDLPDRVRIEVSDTGIGIAPDRLQAVFEPFTQADGSVTRKFGGTGLGLSISTRLAELMGGDLDVKSRFGQGTTFFCRVALRKPTSPRPMRTGQGESVPLLPQLRILVADDDRTNLEIIKSFLEEAGHRVTTAKDGNEALSCFGNAEFDVVLLDIQMPGLDGMAATRQLRAWEEASGRPRTPVIALTAHAMKGDRERFLEAGMDGYGAKPFLFHELLTTIRDVLLPGAGQAQPLLTAASDNNPPPEPGNAALLDLDAAFKAMNSKLWKIGAQIFLEDTPADLKRLSQAVERSDATDIHNAAHKLKGAASNIKAEYMRGLAQELEESSGSHDRSSQVELFARLAASWDPTRACILAALGAL